ncbi:MAG: hypothetical protein LBM78_02720 [Clostridiales bacterium]|jgi:hypothetical protein|nr:hypothetical protein [Clostridiales bacterium]
MRKAIVVIIGLIFFLSIVIVSLFGMRMQSYTVDIPPERVELLNPEIAERHPDGVLKKYLPLKTEDILPETGLMFQFAWRITPADTTYKEVRFIITELQPEDADKVTLSNEGLLTVYGPVSYIFTITVETTGITHRDSVRVYFI